MNNFLILIIITIIAIANILLSAQPFGGGDGKNETTAYKIYTKAHLEEIADSVNTTPPYPANNWSRNKYFKLMNDITDKVVKGIGSLNYRFQGSFDKQDDKINIAITDSLFSVGSGVGLFAVTDRAKITNLTIIGSVNTKLGWVGAFGGRFMHSEIHNCSNYADIVANGSCVGGIIGHLEDNSIVTNCLNCGNVKGGNEVGGIIGHILNSTAYEGEVINCINIGTITGNINAGGIIGLFNKGKFAITDCLNAGYIYTNNGSYGILNIEDLLETKATIYNCVNTGVVSSIGITYGITINE